MELEKIRAMIEEKKKELDECLTGYVGKLCDKKVLRISKQLDELLNQYQICLDRIDNRKQNTEYENEPKE